MKGEDFVPETSKLLGKNSDKKPTSHGVNAEKCPELIGGDSSDATSRWDIRERSAECPATATWYVKRHPIGFSLYFQDGKKLLSLFQEDGQVKQLFAGKFFQGLFHDLLHTVREKPKIIILTDSKAHS
ncbi:MAG: hypothetical protein HC887_09500 [Desulfobacteraceae bacterium]|nr:hypothetical protein [Desulfobacteraceae bacterium]